MHIVQTRRAFNGFIGMIHRRKKGFRIPDLSEMDPLDGWQRRCR